MNSIDVTPPSYVQNNITGTAGVFQVGNATLTGSLLTASIYIKNNDAINPKNAFSKESVEIKSLLS